MAQNNPEFVHLHVHSHYSLLDGATTVAKLVDRALAHGQTALALTDHGNLYGAVEFHDQARKKGLKPLLGMEAYLAEHSMREKYNKIDNRSSHLTLLARNEQGWRNLLTLSSKAFLEGMHYRPRIDKDLLAAHSDGLIALSGCLQGEINLNLRGGYYDKAKALAGTYRDILGPDNYYLELMRINIPEQDRCNEGLLKLSGELGLKVVATNDAHYLTRDDWAAQDMLFAINTGKLLSDENRLRMTTQDIYLKSSEEMATAFEDLPQALANTLEVAEKCDVTLPKGIYHLPVFDPGTGESPEDYFMRLCREGLADRYGAPLPDRVEERLQAETDVILKMGFASYFLITWDFIRYARSIGVPVGPGRGSAAGSIVAYALRITDVDPLKYDLLFERFLNAERVSMPDIDVDICREGRQKIIEYVRQKYGEASVAQIITFTTLATKRAIRDVGKALDVPLPEVDRICKKIPDGGGSLDSHLEADPDLQSLGKSDKSIGELFDYAHRIEGLARDPSTHAAGVVIADRPLIEYAPLCSPQGDVVTQWQMVQVERMGLLKMDFLGLKNLTVLAKAVEIVRANRGVEVDLDNLALDDRKTFELLCRADTSGIFQLESEGMRKLIARLRPDKFEDIIALNALYRPGPLESGMVDNYVANKNGSKPVVYPHPSLEDVLKDTYGNIVYQEQVMLISVLYAGFTLNDSDNLRKAMGKKNPEVMAGFRDKFINGATEKGHSGKQASELFENMAKFARYGFNKSHATAYALLAYRTAYMKAHYPLEFLCGLMTCDAGDSDKLYNFIEDAKGKGIEVLAPDVNRSMVDFHVEGEAIRFAFAGIKGVGGPAAAAIVEARERVGGQFKDLDHFCEEVDHGACNKGALEALIRAGAMDGLGPSRAQAMADLEKAMRSGVQAQEDRRRGQGSLFGLDDGPASGSAGGGSGPRVPEWTARDRLANEKQALGFYLSGHPFQEKGQFFRKLAGHTVGHFATELPPEVDPGGEATLAGMVTQFREHPVKNGPMAGRKMARFRLEDLTGSIQAVVFPATWAECRDKVEEDAIVFVYGKVKRGESPEIIVDEVATPAETLAERVDNLILLLPPALTDDPEGLDKLAALLRRHRGRHRVYLKIREGERTTVLSAGSSFQVSVTEDLLTDLAGLLPAANIGFDLLPPKPRRRKNVWARSRNAAESG